MTSRTEKKIEKELDRAEKHHDKATIAEAKGHLHSADRHENTAAKHEAKAENLAHNIAGGLPAGGIAPYSGLGVPLTGAAAHPTYGYMRLPRDKKAERFEAKAVEWERRGNTMKAQKNREKALRHRQRLQPGYTPMAHPQPYYVDKANRFDQRSSRYQQLGLTQQAQRYQQRALRTRTKHNVSGPLIGGGALPTAATLGHGHTGTGLGHAGVGHTSSSGAYVGPIVPMGGLVYKGLNHPMTGSTQHPTFGYSKLTSAQKAQRFDQKAAEWDKRGNSLKAQKNREKANRYRQMNQAGYVKPTRVQSHYVGRAQHFDQKAIHYQQMGRSDQALRAQQRAQRIRTKHNIPLAGAGLAGAGLAGAGLAGGSLNKYQGLNFPYSGASAHPNYGYQRLPRDQKALRFEQKAAEWERRGNTMKAQKNRDKANRYRQMSQPGYVRPTRPQNYHADRAHLFDQKAARYQQLGMGPQAQRYQGRSQRIRAKHNIPLAGAGLGGAGLAGMGGNRSLSGPYQGLNFPYNGASAHPTYGYQRLPRDQKVLRFEQKAAEWERRGNLSKAQKNREKANRLRQKTQPGYVRPNRPQNYYNDRAHLFDQKAARYHQLGMAPQAQRYQGRSQRIRAKHNIPLAGAGLGGAGLAGLGAHQGSTWTTGQTQVSPLYPAGATYQGLNFPYSGASAHPNYGYQRLPHNKKAERYNLKAAEWERKGNLKRAQKNREKANRYMARSQPGYVRQQRPQNYYVNRANVFDQKANRYQQWGMQPQAQRYQGRSQRVRAKHNIPLATGAGLGAHQGSTWTTGQTQVSPLYPAGTTYQGLSFPYNGASAHPTYGYQRLPRDRKAERFEAKAAEWERRGNLKKSQKNRDKALRIRQKSAPGYVRQQQPQAYYVNRANVFDQKANQYQQWGMQPQAQRYQQRATRVRGKHNLPASAPLYTANAPLYTAARV